VGGDLGGGMVLYLWMRE